MHQESLLTIIEAMLQLSMMTMIGIYFIFSNTVMSALPDTLDGGKLMNSINKQILNPVFLGFFCLSAVASIYFLLSNSGGKAFAGIVFFAGTTLVTGTFSVPLNNRLRDSDDEHLGSVWQHYRKRWVFWNHVRTCAGFTAGLLLLI